MTNVLFIIVILIAGFANGAPSVSSVSGTIGDGNALTVTGTNFGTQPHSKPAVYADFEGPSNDPDSSLGQASSWNARNSLSTTTVSVFEGTYSMGSESGWESTIARVRWDPNPMTNEKAIISWYRRVTYTIADSDNWKWIRVWSKNDGDNFPNWYIGQSPGGNEIAYTEDCDVGTHRKNHNNDVHPSSTWELNEFRIEFNSDENTFDGSYEMSIQGDVVASSTTWAFSCTGAAQAIEEFSLQDDPSNFTPSGDVYYDLVYIDTGTWSRVYLSTSSTLAGSKRFLQPYSAWADTEITITQEWGDQAASADMYVFVCDNNNDCNSSGFQLSSIATGDPVLIGYEP